MWHDSFICQLFLVCAQAIMLWRFHLCDMTHSYVNVSLCDFDLCDMTHSYMNVSAVWIVIVWHDSLMCEWVCCLYHATVHNAITHTLLVAYLSVLVWHTPRYFGLVKLSYHYNPHIFTLSLPTHTNESCGLAQILQQKCAPTRVNYDQTKTKCVVCRICP